MLSVLIADEIGSLFPLNWGKRQRRRKEEKGKNVVELLTFLTNEDT